MTFNSLVMSKCSVIKGVGVGGELVLGDDPVGLYRLGGHGRSSSGGEGPDSWGVENSIAYLFGRVWGHGERSPARVYGSL